jgi:hypothetical protein
MWIQILIVGVVSGVPVSEEEYPPLVPIPNNVLQYVMPYVKYTSASYCEGSALKARSCAICKQPEFEGMSEYIPRSTANVSDPDTGYYWYTAYNSITNTIIVSHRGSRNQENWIDNLNAVILQEIDEPWANGAKLHNGWFNAAKMIMPTLFADLTVMVEKHPTANMVFAGHSMGAGRLIN